MARPTASAAPLTLLAGLLALAACAEEGPPPPTVSGGRGTSGATAARAAAVGPVTTFDGRYTGSVTLNPDRTRRCPDGAPEVEMNVRGGRGSLVINPAARQTLTGTVGSDGAIRLVDNVDRAIVTTGIISTQGFSGQHRNGLCTYAVSLRLVG
ncbi:MAG: hypothetical protein K2X49_18295 [Acetobacteraceae bacterium]|nr:hypothetical protein [Acetobacteraceae bacterium]